MRQDNEDDPACCFSTMAHQSDSRTRRRGDHTSTLVATQTDLVGPPGSESFDQRVVVLGNGNIAGTDPGYDAPGAITDTGRADPANRGYRLSDLYDGYMLVIGLRLSAI